MREVLIVNRIGDDETFRRNTRLTRIHHSRFHPGRDRIVQPGARHNNKRIAPAELEHTLFHLATSGARNGAAGTFASGKRDRFHSWIANDFFDRFIFDQQCLEYARIKTGVAENFFNGESALRHIGGMFKQTNIPCHQGRRRKPEDLPERKVPRHDREDGSERVITDIAPPGIRRYDLFAQKFLAVFSVETATACAFLNFVD